MRIDLTDQVVVIVGSGGMLDKALVEAFNECGAKVALCGQHDLYEKNSITSGDVRFFNLDLSDLSCIENVVKEVVAAYGRIDVLINNPMAALSKTERLPMHEVRPEEFIRLTNEWLKGVMRFAKYCTQNMVLRNKGVIVNYFSIRALMPVADQTTTIAVSAGLHGMTRMWGVEMRDWNIRSNGIAVGVLEDDNELECGNAVRFSHSNIKRPCKAEEAANAAVFLASDAASYITGIVLPVDGGIGAGYARSF